MMDSFFSLLIWDCDFTILSSSIVELYYVTVRFGNICGWLWIMLSGGYEYTRGYDNKKIHYSFVFYYWLSYEGIQKLYGVGGGEALQFIYYHRTWYIWNELPTLTWSIYRFIFHNGFYKTYASSSFLQRTLQFWLRQHFLWNHVSCFRTKPWVLMIMFI